VTNRDMDANWLYARFEKIGGMPSEADEEAFLERVAIMIESGKVEEAAARNWAFTEIFGR
jgi:hypothetical protein